MQPAVSPRPYRLTPLLAMGIPQGYRFDERSGTLQLVDIPSTTPTPSGSPTTRIDQLPSTLCSKCTEHECICNDGVYVNGKRQADPKQPDYISRIK